MTAAPINDRHVVPIILIVAAMSAATFAAPAFGAYFSSSPIGNWANLIGQFFYWGVLIGGMSWRLQIVGTPWRTLFAQKKIIEVIKRGLLYGLILIGVHITLTTVSVVVASFVFGSETIAEMSVRERGAVDRLVPHMGAAAQSVLLVLTAVLAAPIVEELFFRGYVYRVFKHYAGHHAVWMSGLLFAVAHMYMLNFLPIFALGILLAIMYERSGDIRVPIAAHAAVNAFVACIALLNRGAG